MLALQAPALAADNPSTLETVVVRGSRAGLATAQTIKRDAGQIIDSVVADDIGKLPDASVSEALQRVTGVQIARDRGEGNGVTIRGLTQMETTLNGREVFSANLGRALDFSVIPAELVSRLNVYKSSSAEQLEGGLAGTIDLRTRRPFDFTGNALAGSVRTLQGSLVARSTSQFSGLASGRWATTAAGEVGALVSLSVQNRGFREDQITAGTPITRTDLVAGRNVVAPNGISQTTSLGDRDRRAASVVLQWRPWSALSLYAEGHYADMRTRQDSYQINVGASRTFVPGSAALFDGTDDLRRVTWTNAPVSVLSFARDTVDRTRQAAIGGTWNHGAWEVAGDLSLSGSSNTLFFSGPFMAATATNFSQDFSARIPSSVVTGTDLTNPASFRYTGVAYRANRNNGKLPAAQVDVRYRPSDGLWGELVREVAAGVRYARRSASNSPGLRFGDVAVAGLSPSQMPQAVMLDPYTAFPGTGAATIGRFLVADLAGARDAVGLRSAFGITTPLPTAASATSLWRIEEETQSAYVLARFESVASPLAGQLNGSAGLRLVRVRESVTGAQTVPADGSTAPIAIAHADSDILPSVNLRYAAGGGVFVRVAASKTITRPDFAQLSPSLTLIPNSVNPELNQGSAGNPALRPIRSDNLDLALEAYPSRSTSMSLTAFYKRVDGFLATVSSAETHEGVTYQVSRPQNSRAATIRGVELGYQQFYDFLPGWLGGTGLQANYTYIDSETPDSNLGNRVPLQNLSKNSVNLIGLYERGDVSARLAWNWRDRFLSGVTNVVGLGALPVYTRAYGWLDASIAYRLTDTLTVSIAGANLLNTLRQSYYGSPTRPQSSWIGDRQLSASLSVRL